MMLSFQQQYKKKLYFIQYALKLSILEESILYLSSMNSSDPQWDKIEFKT